MASAELISVSDPSSYIPSQIAVRDKVVGARAQSLSLWHEDYTTRQLIEVRTSFPKNFRWHNLTRRDCPTFRQRCFEFFGQYSATKISTTYLKKELSSWSEATVFIFHRCLRLFPYSGGDDDQYVLYVNVSSLRNVQGLSGITVCGDHCAQLESGNGRVSEYTDNANDFEHEASFAQSAAKVVFKAFKVVLFFALDFFCVACGLWNIQYEASRYSSAWSIGGIVFVGIACTVLGQVFFALVLFTLVG